MWSRIESAQVIGSGTPIPRRARTGRRWILVRCHCPLRDGKAESSSAFRAASSPVDPVKPLEDAAPVLFLNAAATIPDFSFTKVGKSSGSPQRFVEYKGQVARAVFIRL